MTLLPKSVPTLPYTFLGLENVPAEQADVVVVLAPFDSTVSFQSGSRWGPLAFINASRQVELWRQEYGGDVSQHITFHTTAEIEWSANPKESVDRIAEVTAPIFAAKKFSLLIGGEHSLTSGAVHSALAQHTELTVLQLDAHSDLRNEWNSSTYSHACVMRRCHELGAKLVQVGIRNSSEEEQKFIQEINHKHIYYAPDVPIEEIVNACTDTVYLSIDLDCFDSSIMPATGTPEPGGLTWYQVVGLLKELFAKRNVVGADLMELMPIPGLEAPNFLAAKLAYEICTLKFLSQIAKQRA